eukprot:XP_001694670.1 hypothetical protein CHLREDRAFT_148896 [Chlamydomonas reinhardtii]
MAHSAFCIAMALGLLCRAAVAIDAAQSTASSSQDAFVGEKLLHRWREMLSARADKGEPAPSVFEQAFTATFTSKQEGEVERTLEQFSQLMAWVDTTPSPNATQLAFLPELRSDAARELAALALALAKSEGADAKALVASLNAISAKLQSASSWRGYAAGRRMLVGAILKKRMDFGGRFPLEVQAAVDAVMLQLFQMHKLSVANRGAVQFFHVSKSGGTNLCQSAEANGCASQGFDTRTNCLIRDFADQPRWVTYNAHKYVQYRMSSRQALPWFVNFHTYRAELTCDQRRAYLLRNGLTFYANEYTNPPTGIPAGASAEEAEAATSGMCEDFVNLIMFRHPHDRLRSQIGWVQKLYKEFYLDTDTQKSFVNRTTGFWERLMPAGVNNYYIRSLLGQRFFEFPVTQVLPQHVTLAKLAALQHDILLSLDAKPRNELALRVGLGWAQALRDDVIRSSAELGDAVALPIDYTTMLERNAPDVEVYNFAREMQALDTLLWNFVSIADAQLGGGSNLSSDKCGYVSMGTEAAVQEREKRYADVVIPASSLRTGGVGVNGVTGAPPADTADAAAAAVRAADSANVEGEQQPAGAKEEEMSTGTGKSVLRGAADSSSSSSTDTTSKRVISISRRTRSSSHRRMLH